MAQIVVRNLPYEVMDGLRRRAVQHDRSLEAEVRAILSDAVTSVDPVVSWLDDSAALGEAVGGVDLPEAARSAGSVHPDGWTDP
ncbi:Arc family DNA-binding protein [Cellulomonas sp. H30R-01]|uniref:FitA-like ribbon-helix-helix domain-containing protein n=1 Tax=Cellulomonas sp. H30R-01 TaxID=2704467 RepID=UPI00138C9E5E|nr:Arc family DNA-binding protein [Cellulomonas sp. H30R-01]QHT57930.1 Arc family DNA-binding protein [Cellulomonas sp. H30R-01]